MKVQNSYLIHRGNKFAICTLRVIYLKQTRKDFVTVTKKYFFLFLISKLILLLFEFGLSRASYFSKFVFMTEKEKKCQNFWIKA